MVILKVHVKPNSKESVIESYDKWRNTIVVRLKSPAIKGKANRELENVLSDFFKCKVEIVSGIKSKNKTIFINLNEKDVYDKLRGI